MFIVRNQFDHPSMNSVSDRLLASIRRAGWNAPLGHMIPIVIPNMVTSWGFSNSFAMNTILEYMSISSGSSCLTKSDHGKSLPRTISM